MKNLKTERSKYIHNYLKENYSKKSKNDIISDLGLSWNYIQKMAHLLDIKRSFSESNKSFSLSKLLDGSNISYYWIGFILADGHMTKNNTIQINLNKKDILHLEKLKSLRDGVTIDGIQYGKVIVVPEKYGEMANSWLNVIALVPNSCCQSG